MRDDAIELGTASALSNRGRRYRRRGERFRNASRTLAGRHSDVEVIDEAFAGFTRVDSAASPKDGRPHKKTPAIPVELAEGLSAQLKALDCQRHQLVQLLQSIDRDSQSA